MSVTDIDSASTDSDVRPVPFRGGGFKTIDRKFVGLGVFIVLFAFWEWGSRSGFISSLVLPAPSEALEAFMDLARSGDLQLHLAASLQRLVLGFTCGTLLGLTVGTLIGLNSLARAGISPLVSAIFPIPKIALLPLFIIWFGIGEGSKVATILFGSFFPTVIATYSGIDGVDRTLIRMGQSFGLSRWHIIRKIVLPATLPSILSGMRISASISIILLVAAEMIGAEYGIGAYVLLAGNLMATDQLIAGVVMLSILGLIVNFLISRAEKYLLSWRS
ncbi:ABC transporter permease [Chachezhania antarctica]|uniref:ABC transporter permease n=1 Tax=Chachezhania antarctica TaxID=2340860 RepID=UPI000EAC53C5|nr:ABC transporter permease [Chachezhania antarctica]|tara:strand:- start:8464 stop:9288 length:825 start_codon:yes stop_codon:yes gene_type:complete